MNAKAEEIRNNVADALPSNNAAIPAPVDTGKRIVITDDTLDNVRLQGIRVELGQKDKESGKVESEVTFGTAGAIKKHVVLDFDGVDGTQMRALIDKTARALWIRFQDKVRRDSSMSDFKKEPYELVIKASELLVKQKREKKVKELTTEEIKTAALDKMTPEEKLAFIAELQASMK